MPGWVVADCGYSSHTFRNHIRKLGAKPTIQPKRSKALDACRDWIYIHLNQIKWLWARVKECSAVTTRYEKAVRSYMGVLSLAATMDWLRR